MERIIKLSCLISIELSGNCRQNVAIKELLEVIYPRPKQDEHVVRLEPIPGNQNAVFQHLTKQSVVDHKSFCQSSNHSMENWKDNQPESQGRDMREQNAGGESEDEDVNEGNNEVPTDRDAQGDEQEDGGQEEISAHQPHIVPISLLLGEKEIQAHSPRPKGKCCPVCFKTFATKANVRRHFDEVHRGLRRDLLTLDISTKSSDLEVLYSGPLIPYSLQPKTDSPLPQYNLATCKCLLCKRSYSTQARLKRHMRFVHKILACKNSLVARKHRSKEGTDTQYAHEHLKRPREEHKVGKPPVVSKPKLSLGFDFKQLFCKLCKRQFSSRQNLDKHIELHTDNGNDIFIKFYRCPLCRYESRRKRDVLRHISVVHKKSSAYLSKILPSLESRALKKPAETVLSSSVKRSLPKDHQKGDAMPHRLQKVSPPSSVPPVFQNPDVPPPSPPVTRRQSLSLQASSVTCNQNSNGLSNCEEAQDSSEVRVTKNFSLHACDMCGRAFAKKVYLESHKRSHRNAAKTDSRMMGVSTRSRSLLW